MSQPSVEVIVDAPESEDVSAGVEAVAVVQTIDHAGRIAALEAELNQLRSAVVEVEVDAMVAQEVAEGAQMTADVALTEAVDANQETAALSEAVEVIAEETASTEDDAVVEEVVVPEAATEDVPARKPNFWFDNDLRGRFKR